VCPIHGTSGSSPVRVDYTDAATPSERAAAAVVVAAFDFSPAAQAAWEDARRPERTAVRAAAGAVADIDTYLALGAPSNAQVVAQVRRLSQVVRALVRHAASQQD
jgi:hypothetical protein